MELKVIIYIIIGVGYFIYSAYKKVNDEKGKVAKPKAANPPASKPKPKSWLEEMVEKMQQEAEKAKQQTTPQPKVKPQKQRPLRQKDLIVQEVGYNRTFEEDTSGEVVYERPLTSEEILHNERMRASKPEAIEIFEEETTASINAREAFIGSIIFERKF
jgi:hypothetical protein